ncbi:MAG: phosphoglycerate dehydrogenase [Actinomycetota bacterium]
MNEVAITPRSFRTTPGPHHKALTELQLTPRFPRVERPLSEEEMVALVSGCPALIVGIDNVSADVLDAGPLRVVVKYGSGLDNIDEAALEERDVAFATTGSANARSVAELAMGLVFALARGIALHDRIIRDGRWTRTQGVELAGKRLGIIGYGAIGKELAQIGTGCGFTVVAHDPYADTGDIEAVSLEELLASSDVVSLHLPLTRETAGLIGRRELAFMRPSAFLVNTARGDLVDDRALADALSEQRIAGAAFDAFSEEPPGDSALVGLDNFISSPHAGAATAEAVVRAGVMAAQLTARLLTETRAK